MVLCNHIEGLGITFDPSVLIVGPAKQKNIDRILKFVYHVHLRDTKPGKFQVSIGQGEVDYAKIISQLEREMYDRALAIHMVPMEDLDHRVELRKLRRLLENTAVVRRHQDHETFRSGPQVIFGAGFVQLLRFLRSCSFGNSLSLLLSCLTTRFLNREIVRRGPGVSGPERR